MKRKGYHDIRMEKWIDESKYVYYENKGVWIFFCLCCLKESMTAWCNLSLSVSFQKYTLVLLRYKMLGYMDSYLDLIRLLLCFLTLLMYPSNENIFCNVPHS